MHNSQLQSLVLIELEDLKALDIKIIDVQKLTTITDLMIICNGRSARHVKAIAKNLIQTMKSKKCLPLGVEGLEGKGEWVLVDLDFIIVHIMMPETREFYALEKLWEINSGTE